MALSRNKKEIKIAPYSKLALIYDDVMAHVDYDLWAKYVSRIFKKYNCKINYLLDISCGTGSFILSSLKRNQIYFGCDYSFPMLQRAKTKSKGKNIHLFLADMTNFSLKPVFNGIVCLYDSINYVLEPALWERNLKCAHQALSAGGIYIFDICTELNSVKYFHNYVEQGAGYGYRYVRESYFDDKKRIHHNKFFIEFDGENCIYFEDHQQLILPIETVVRICESSPFDLIAYYDGFTFKRGSEKSLRVHFVLRK